MSPLDNFIEIKKKAYLLNPNIKIIIVCKNQEITNILPILNSGHREFGENKIQEAKKKWTNVSNSYDNLKLHFIGKLQSNKVEEAILNFKFIHSLDSKKLAEEIHRIQIKKDIFREYFIQINLANEVQKSGAPLEQAENFIDYCKIDLKLNIVGLMCIPPVNKNPSFFFNLLANLAKSKKLSFLSMGMSSDYIEAIKCGATHIRLGSAIFN